MTAPDSVERVVAEMQHYANGSTSLCPASVIDKWADRLQALARGPQRAGGEDDLVGLLRDRAAGGDKLLESSADALQALQAEVARLRELLSGSRNVLDLLRSVVSAEGVSKFTHVESRSGSLVYVQSTIDAIDAALNGGRDDA